jgi:hypothetical protein
MRAGGRLEEVFLECAEKMEFPGFGFLRQAKPVPRGGEKRLPKEKTRSEGSKEADWMHTVAVPGAKMEIPDKKVSA